jgi:regulator of RNase E activity RraA
MFPQMGVRVAYAATLTFSEAADEYAKLDPFADLDHIKAMPKPVVVVCQDVSSPAFYARACLFGEVRTTRYKVMGASAVVTDGVIRDLDEIERLGVQYFAGGVTASHGNLMVREVGVPVEIAGLRVEPGDLLHMDKHGVVKVPKGRIADVLQAVEQVRRREGAMLEFLNSPGFSLDALKQKTW